MPTDPGQDSKRPDAEFWRASDIVGKRSTKTGISLGIELRHGWMDGWIEARVLILYLYSTLAVSFSSGESNKISSYLGILDFVLFSGKYPPNLAA